MTMPSQQRGRLVVVGGGVAGLAAARAALDLMPDLDVCVLESAREPGGLVETERTADGFLIEYGADCLVTGKPAGLSAVRHLGLGGALRPPAAGAAATFVAKQDTLLPLPPGVGFGAPASLVDVLFSRSLSAAAKARMACEPWMRAKPAQDDESVAAFIGRRFGAGFLQQVVAPVLESVYGAPASALSARACLPRLCALEQRSGSVVRGLRAARAAGGEAQVPALTLSHGMGALVHALARSLATRVRTGVAVVEITRGPKQTFRVHTRAGVLEADAVILATPAHTAAALSEGLSASLAALLGEVRHGRLDSLTVAFRRGDVPHALEGSGFVVPRAAGRRTRACTWSSSKWEGRAPDGFVLIRSMLEASEANQEELLEGARRDLAELLGIRVAPVLMRVRRRRHGLPIHDLGCVERARRMHAEAAALDGLSLAGSAHGAMGVSDCIESGRRAAESMLAQRFGVNRRDLPQTSTGTAVG